jgi:hypothetical protein
MTTAADNSVWANQKRAGIRCVPGSALNFATDIIPRVLNLCSFAKCQVTGTQCPVKGWRRNVCATRARFGAGQTSNGD